MRERSDGAVRVLDGCAVTGLRREAKLRPPRCSRDVGTDALRFAQELLESVSSMRDGEFAALATQMRVIWSPGRWRRATIRRQRPTQKRGGAE